MTDTIELLSTRRSVPGANLVAPAPEGDELQTLLTVATRVPDHGKLEPWRIILLQGEAIPAFCEKMVALFQAREPAAAPEQLQKERGRFNAPLVVIVVSRAGEHPKIPVWEQVLSAGAVCMNLETAALALGYGSQWLTGWPAYDADTSSVLGLSDGEKVAGFILVGTPTLKLPDRPRPDLSRIVTHWRAD